VQPCKLTYNNVKVVLLIDALKAIVARKKGCHLIIVSITKFPCKSEAKYLFLYDYAYSTT